MEFCACARKIHVLQLKDPKDFFFPCIFWSQLFHKEAHFQEKKIQEEQGRKFIGLVRELKMIFLLTSSVVQGQSICLISAFTSKMLSLGLNSCWSEVRISPFYVCSAFLTVALVHDEP